METFEDRGETFEDRGTRRRAARARRKAGLRPKSTRGARALAFVASLGLVSPAPLEAMHSRGTLGIPSIIRVGGSLLYDRAHNTTMTAGTVDDSDPVMTLDALTYTVTITNTGGTGLRGLSVAFTIDANSTYVSASAGGFDSVSQSGGVVTAALASGPVAGGTASFTITVTTPATAMTLTASLSATATNATTQTDTETTGVQLVAKDATSGIRCPASAAQWTSLRACKGVLGTPSMLWLCQEPSGSLADSIGSFTGTPLASPSYGNTVAGWSRKALGSNSGRWFNSSASLPNTATQSMAVIGYIISVGTVVGTKYLFPNQAGTGAALQKSDGTQLYCGKFSTNATSNTASNQTSVTPGTVLFDRTNSKNTAYTKDDKLTKSFESGVTGQIVHLFDGTNLDCQEQCLYLAVFFTSNAEFSDAQLKATHQACGWPVVWT